MKKIATRYLPRQGFILMLVIILVFVVMTLGGSYLISTIQSKNIYQVFYRDEIALMVAESVAAEWRIKKFPAIQAVLENTSAKPADSLQKCTLNDLPVSKALAYRLSGGSNIEVNCSVLVKDFDNSLEMATPSGVKWTKKFGNEYQATLRLDINIKLGSAKTAKNSRFVFEYDLKNTNLRSNSVGRTAKGYTTSASNDYLLYVRDAMDEFNSIKGQSLNKDNITLTLAQPTVGKKGKIFLGCGPDKNSTKYVFINITDEMKDMIPTPPKPMINIPWTEFSAEMSAFALRIKTRFDKIQQEIDNDSDLKKFGIKFDVTKAIGRITVDYDSMPEKDSLLQKFVGFVQQLFQKFFKKFEKIKDLKIAREVNKEKGIQILGSGDPDYSVCEQIEGNLRQRFWQTSIFTMDYSNIVTGVPAEHQAKLDEKLKEVTANSKIELGFHFENEVPLLGGGDKPELTELYRYIYKKQKQDNTLLMSQANSMFPFKKAPDYGERNPEAKVPLGISGDALSFIPFPFYLVRSHLFETDESFKRSKFYDSEKKIIHLNGIISITDPKGIIIDQDTTFTGKGVLLSYYGFHIMGSFTRNQQTDGPCFLYTYMGNISANEQKQGKIEASLIALHWKYPAMGFRSHVNFNGKKAEVWGNVIVDELKLQNMEISQNNIFTYNPNLHGDTGDLYDVFLGARLRSMALVHDMP